MTLENPNQPGAFAAPSGYTRGTSFTDWEANHPTEPVPGTSLDTEFNSVAVAIASVIARLSLIQGDAGTLKNGIVTAQSLDPQLTQILASGFNPRGEWITGTAYAKQDAVSHNAGVYVAVRDHTAGVDFNTDLNAGLWMLWVPNQKASAIAVDPIPNVSGNNVQDCLVFIGNYLQTLNNRVTALEAKP
ncbi:hypothetical protein IB275_30295 [Pseudomonas sp. PDM21]|uniref:hypothetical protein n=1 Tax=Pseudomonas sp. PDM21 TaxID=2769257 RepID=UPI0017859717|nr:hypothetical protein [Pseudomonas sp. PDM21]MBD9674906.1 hypothetical protein [Pseudomonas sp. PDM21]